LLKNQGIQYVEVRGIDLNPHKPVGISKKQIRILDLLLIYCLITPSPQMDNEEKNKIDEQDKNIIKAGKSADAKVWFKGEEVAISSARNELIEELKFIADELSDELYVEAINLGDVYKNKFYKNDSFHEAGIIKAIENVKAINTFTNIDLEVCEKEASDSLKEFDRINQLQEINFEEFIDSYNSKI
jgi:glutamate--cysteine ligase